MRILVLRKRPHTNQYPQFKTLIDKGHEVRFLVHYRERMDIFGFIVPEVLPPSRLRGPLRRMAKLVGLSEIQLRAPVPSITRLFSIFQSFRPELVIVYNTRLDTHIVSAIARLYRVPVVLNLQKPADAMTVGFRLARFGLVPKVAYAWIRPNDEKAVLPHHFYLPPPVESPDELPVQARPLGSPIRVICVGKFIQPRKRHKLLLEAIALLRDRLPLQATLVGAGDEDNPNFLDVQRHIATLKLSDCISIRRNVPFKAINRLYDDHDIFVIPSRDEAYSISLLEAMARGLPVICSDTNQARDCIEPGRNGLVFLTDDARDLARCLYAVGSDAHQLELMGRQSFELARTRHHPDEWHRCLMEIADHAKVLT